MAESYPSGSGMAVRRRGGVLKKTLVVLVAIVVIVVLALGLLAPPIASSAARAMLESTSDSIAGTLEVGDVRIGWTGPARADGLRLLDVDGREIAALSARADIGLLSLLGGALDLGDISVGGTIDLREETGGVRAFEAALAPPRDISAPTAVAAATGASDPVRLPPGLRVVLASDELEVRFTDAAGTTQSESATLQGMFEVGGGITVDVALASGAAALTGDLTGVTSADGALTLDQSNGSVGAVLRGPAWWLGGPSGGDFEASGRLEIDGGLVRVDDAPSLTVALPAEATSVLTDDALMAAAAVRVRVRSLDLALPADGRFALADWRGAQIDAVLETEAIVGSARGVEERASISIAPASFALTGADGTLRLRGETTVAVAGLEESPASIDLVAGGLLDEQGRLRGGGPTALTGTLRAEALPTALVGMVVDFGVDLERVAGATVAVDVRADVSQSEAGDQPRVLATVRSDRLEIVAPLTMDGRGVHATGDGVRITTDAAAEVIGGLAGVEGAGSMGGRAEVSMPNFSVLLDGDAPMVRARGIVSLSSVPIASIGTAADAAHLLMGPAVDGEIGFDVAEGVTTLTPMLASSDGTDRWVRGGVEVRDDVVRSVGLVIETRMSEAMLQALGAETVELVRPGGPIRISVERAEIPIAGRDSFAPLRGIDASIVVRGSNQLLHWANERWQLVGWSARGSLTPDGRLEVGLDGQGVRDAGITEASGTLWIDGMHDDGVPELIGATFGGEWALDGVPTALLERILPGSTGMATELAGEEVRLTIGSSERIDGAWEVQFEGDEASMGGPVVMMGDLLRVGPMQGACVLTQELVEEAALAGYIELTPLPELATPAPVEITFLPMDIPLAQRWRPSVADRAVVRGSLRVLRDTVVRNVPRADGTTGDTGIRAGSTLGVVVNSGERRGDGVTVLARPFAPSDPEQEAGEIEISMILGQPVLDGHVYVRDGHTRTLDALLGLDGWLTDAMGPITELGIVTEMQLQGQRTERTIGVTGWSEDTLELGVRFLRQDGGGFQLASTLHSRWRMPAAFAARLLNRDATNPLQVLADVGIGVRGQQLTLGPPETPLAPDVFEMSVYLEMGGLALQTADGSQAIVPPMRGWLTSGELPGTLGFAFDAPEPAAGPAPPGEDAMTMSSLTVAGALRDVSDSSGRLTLDASHLAGVQAQGRIATTVVEALAGTGGTLAALLGPELSIEAEITPGDDDAPGRADVHLWSANAEATLQGDVRDGTIRADQDTMVSLRRITPEASTEIFAIAFPFLEQFEKTTDDRPATVEVMGLTLPMNGDLRQLNGVATVDLGTMQFRTSPLLSRLLEATANNTMGRVGERIEPFEIRIMQGVLQYEDVTLPAGEFELVTYGEVDLAARRVNMHVLVPFHALSGDLASVAGRVPGVGRLTSVPLKVSGGFDATTVEVDLEELVRQIPNAIGEGLLEDALGDLLRGLGDR
ncbi:MAG: hypothetical protein AAFX05_06400 [Planctomycetota bacterium]